jgi:protein O-mannosyl-transferase
MTSDQALEIKPDYLSPKHKMNRLAANLVVICGLLLAVIAVYGQTAGHDFVNFDDGDYVYENRQVQEGLTGAGVAWAFSQARVSAHWHPLTWLSLMADVQLLKPREGPPNRPRLAAEMHLVNVALHAASSLVLFLLLRAVTGSVWPSACAAAIFAIHPLHVESVAWVTERKDVLSGLFGLLSLWAYAGYARRPSLFRYLLVFAALALGLMAKPMLVTWPFLLLLFDYWPLCRQGAGSHPEGTRRGAGGRRRLTWLLVEKLPLVLLAAASAAVTFLAQKSGGSVISLERVSLSQRVVRATMLYVDYLGKSVWPANLAAFYPGVQVYGAGPALAAAALLVLLTAGAVWGAGRGRPWLAVGWFWYLATLAPAIGLVQVGAQVMADRFLYLPQIGISIALVWTVADLVTRHSPRVNRHSIVQGAAAVLFTLFLSALTVRAWQQTSYWRNSERLWNHALACTSNNSYAHAELGQALYDRGQAAEAKSEYGQALALDPRLEMAHFNLAVALAAGGRYDDAIAHYAKALEIDPSDAQAHNNLGRLFAARGHADEAVAHYRRALQIDPDFAEARCNLGAALASHGMIEESIAAYRQALQASPQDASAENNLGEALFVHGDFGDAASHFHKATELDPRYAEAWNNLGKALVAQGQFQSAAAAFQQALAIDPKLAPVWNNLAGLLSKMGRFQEAATGYRRAIAIDPRFAEAHKNLALILDDLGQRREAAGELRTALEIKPDYAEAHNCLGALLMDQAGTVYSRSTAEAIVHFRRAIAINPKFDLPHANLGRALSRQGQYAAAAGELRTFLGFQPNHPAVLGWLAWLLATAPEDTVRNGKEAVDLAEKAARESQSPESLDTLAAAYAECRRFPEAVETARKAKKAAEDAQNQALRAAIEARLKLYEAEKPYHEGR